MLLWDYEMKTDLGLLDQLSSSQLLAISVTEIERVGESVLSKSSDAREIYSTCLAKFHEARDKSDGYMPVLDDDLDDELRMASVEIAEWGTGPLMAAMSNCCGLPDMPMKPIYTREVLGLCYQAVMEYQEIGDITPETERQYPALLEAIRFQKDLIHRGPSL